MGKRWHIFNSNNENYTCTCVINLYMNDQQLCTWMICTSSSLVVLPTICAVMWRTMIQSQGGLKSISGSLDLSSLAKISDGYSAGHIEKSVTTILTDRRIQQVRKTVCVCVWSFLVRLQTWLVMWLYVMIFCVYSCIASHWPPLSS